MFGNRRLAKRSIVGSCVSALATDGCYYPSIIESTQTRPNGEDGYTIAFKEGPFTRTDVTAKHIVGPGFSTVGEIRLVAGQKVFLTQNGREVPGVICDDGGGGGTAGGQVRRVRVSAVEFGEDEILLRRHDDVRLMASRKSARLQTNDTNYSRLADLHPDNKKRTVSSVIDVPVKSSRKKHHHHHHHHHQHSNHHHYHQPSQQNNNHHNYYHQQPQPHNNHHNYQQQLYLPHHHQQHPQHHHQSPQTWNHHYQNLHHRRQRAPGGWTTDAMDEQTAALVLTSLSCSPTPPPLAPTTMAGVTSGWKPGSHGSSSGRVSSSASSSPSPPPPSSSQRPLADVNGAAFSLAGAAVTSSRDVIDEGLELGAIEQRDGDTYRSKFAPEVAMTETVFQCTWPGCCEQRKSCSSIEQHVRTVHLGRGENNDSDHEEEFYYKEVEIGMDVMTRSFADMNTEPMLTEQSEDEEEEDVDVQIDDDDDDVDGDIDLDDDDLDDSEADLDSSDATGSDNVDMSPRGYAYIADHDYQKKNCSVPLAIPGRRHSNDQISPLNGRDYGGEYRGYERLSMSSSCNQYSHSTSASACRPHNVSPQSSGQRCPTTTLSVSLPSHYATLRRARAEVKKCRKVYGMEKRDMWCTQCKWKKACTRFHE